MNAECHACRVQACEVEGNTAEPHTCVPAVCSVCHTRITQIQPSGMWIHAVRPRRWHPATPTTTARRAS